jgi:L-2-hydroxyglutarate oxidase LhgO
MNQADIVIIGAGVVGLAIAQRLSYLNKKVVLLERHATFGQDASTRNSEVIHGGMYYPTNSLKARLCVEGNRQLYRICQQNGIPHRRTGKLIIANSDEELSNIEEIYQQGQINRVPELVMLEEKEIKKIEPHVRAKWALMSPSSGILDATALMGNFEDIALHNGVRILYEHEVIDLEKLGEKYRVIMKRSDKSRVKMVTEVLINAAGLYADKIASMLGIDIDQHHYRIHWVKGEYFNIDNRHQGKMTHLIYPTPTPVSLGIHVRLRMDGTFALGPNAIYVNAIDYDVDPAHAKEFFESCHSYLPFLEQSDLSPGIAGIRAKLQAEGESAQDFVIRSEADKDLPGFINLVGIDSPALTASVAIGGLVYEIYQKL